MVDENAVKVFVVSPRHHYIIQAASSGINAVLGAATQRFIIQTRTEQTFMLEAGN